jgi:hypothetical protein
MASISLGGLPIQFDVTARDFASIRTELIALAEKLTPEWTDFSDADPGVIILESLAHLADMLHYVIDRAHNEGYLLTAQERDSVVKLLRLIGYELSARTAATVNLTVVTDAPNVVIPAGQKVTSTASGATPAQTFELPTAITLVATGTHTVITDPDLVAIHGESVGLEAIGVSDGKPNQYMTLAQYPIALNPDGSTPLRVFVDATEWFPSGISGDGTSFLGDEADSEVFGWQIDADGLATIKFGDGVNGAVPPVSAVIAGVYRVGGGKAANSVGKRTITTFSPAIIGVVSVTNEDQPSGGSDAETIEHAKKHGPLSLQALNRAVTLGDFEVLAKAVPGGGVKSARAYQGDSPWVVNVYIMADGTNPVPTGQWFPRLDSGTGLIGGVGRFLTERKAVPARLEVYPVVVVIPYVSLTVYALSNYLRSAIRGELQDRLITLFEAIQDDFGIGLPTSRVVQVVENTPGVDWVQVNALHRSPYPKVITGNEDALSLATFSLSGINEQTEGDTYDIQWRSSTTFEIKGLNGKVFEKQTQTYQFSAGVEYEIKLFPVSTKLNVPREKDQFDLEITLDAVTKPNRGDIWRFGVDPIVGNINVLPYEVIRATVLAGNKLDPSQVLLAIEGGIGR